MVALDNQTPFLGERRGFALGLPALAAMAATVVILGAMASRGFADNGFRLGSLMGWRFTGIMLFIALVGGPLARLLSHTRLHLDSKRLSRDLVWCFAGSYFVYLASLMLPNVLGREGIAPGMLVFALFGGGVAAAMAAAIEPGLLDRLGDKARRAILGVSAIYFWMCFSLMALSHLYGPHRPDGFYGFSLVLMLVALLVRFADRFLSQFHYATPSAA